MRISNIREFSSPADLGKRVIDVEVKKDKIAEVHGFAVKAGKDKGGKGKGKGPVTAAGMSGIELAMQANFGGQARCPKLLLLFHTGNNRGNRQ